MITTWLMARMSDAPLITSMTAAEVLEAFLASPEKAAVMEWDPAESEVVENEAAPPFSVAEPIWFLPSLNATLPVAVAGVTKAVKVTFAPVFAGFTSAVRVVDVVAGEPGPGGEPDGEPGVPGDAADADGLALPP